jgi:hypothetical protein
MLEHGRLRMAAAKAIPHPNIAGAWTLPGTPFIFASKAAAEREADRVKRNQKKERKDK